ncbi:flagellar brake protein [Clostridium hydrogeniformans]|uniref:flagellar brake protein n=1 Tax=Clostridium hydrogeniformans TaxID=349933 RepID=UPI00054FA347|nr:flagellar brake domain-containing protein [Clostridium hydrogeniformans]
MELNLSINGKIDLYWKERVFKSNIQDIKKDYVVIGMPMIGGDYLPLAKGDTIEIVYYDSLSLYHFHTEVVGRTKEGDVHQIFINHPKTYKKIQRRNYVRVATVEYIEYTLDKKDEEDCTRALMLDLSGGGLKFKDSRKLRMKDTIKIIIKNSDIQEKINGKIVRIDKDEDGRYIYGVGFYNTGNVLREKIIQYVFNIMRKQRKSALKEE